MPWAASATYRSIRRARGVQHHARTARVGVLQRNLLVCAPALELLDLQLPRLGCQPRREDILGLCRELGRVDEQSGLALVDNVLELGGRERGGEGHGDGSGSKRG